MGTQLIPGAKRESIFLVDPDEIVLVEEPGPYYDERVHEPVKESLVRSIIRKGVRVPVLIVRQGDQTIAIDGRRRIKAAREAKRRGHDIMVRCVPQRDASDELDAAEIAIIANEIRFQDNAILRARKMAGMLAKCGDIDRTADMFGVKKTRVNQLLRLLDLAPATQRAVRSGKLSESAAMALYGRPVEEQEAALQAVSIEDDLNGPSSSEDATPVDAEVTPTNGVGAPEARQRKRPSRAQVERAIKKGDEGDNESDSTKRPKLPDLRRILEAAQEEGSINVEAYNLMSWIIVRIDEDKACQKIPWLSRAIRALKATPSDHHSDRADA